MHSMPFVLLPFCFHPSFPPSCHPSLYSFVLLTPSFLPFFVSLYPSFLPSWYSIASLLTYLPFLSSFLRPTASSSPPTPYRPALLPPCCLAPGPTRHCHTQANTAEIDHVIKCHFTRRIRGAKLDTHTLQPRVIICIQGLVEHATDPTNTHQFW